MKKIIIRIMFVLLVTILFSSIGLEPKEKFVTTLYTVIGIIFSILFSLSISFNLDKITNKNFLNKCRNEIYYVQRQFIFYFVAATLTVFFQDYSFSYSYKFISFTSKSLYSVIMLFLVFYFIINFKNLQKLKDKITDKIIKETTPC